MKARFTLTIAFLGACSTTFSKAEADAVPEADYGPKPSKAQIVAAVNNWAHGNLLDPMSMILYLPEPPRVWRTRARGNAWKGWIFGWGCPISINAKNRMGGYVGKKDYLILIRDGALAQIDEVDTLNMNVQYGEPAYPMSADGAAASAAAGTASQPGK